jgi:hypothetical protein
MKPFNKPFDQSMDRLIANLSEAYQSKAADIKPASKKWQENVMRSVRQIDTIDAINDRERFGHLSWRLAPVAMALLILMTLWIVRVDDSLEFQIASLVVSDPAQTDVYNPF